MGLPKNLNWSYSVARYRRPPGRLSCGSPDPHIAARGVDAASTAGLETGATSRAKTDKFQAAKSALGPMTSAIVFGKGFLCLERILAHDS